MIGLTSNPWASGSILMVMVYMGGHISGAHYNPAVKLAVLMRKNKRKEAAFYMLFQVVGGVLGALVAYLFQKHTFAPALGLQVSITNALLIELIFTFALATVVLNVATTKATSGNNYFGLAIGFTAFVAAMAGGASQVVHSILPLDWGHA